MATNEMDPKLRASLFNTRADKPPTGYLTTLIHILKGNIGAGLYAMGSAFKNGGLIVSIVLLNFIAVVCVHCEHVLIGCAERMRVLYGEETCADFAETVELCFINGPKRMRPWGGAMRHIVQIFICITQLGFCCVYILFIATTLFQVFEANGINIPLYYLIALTFFPVLIVSLITNLNVLMPVSLVANICMFAGLIMCFYFALKDGLPSISERKLSNDPMKLALFFGTCMFAYEGIALVLPLRNVMKQPTKFEAYLGVLNTGMTFATMLFLASGFLGYLKWGEQVEGSITLNLGKTVLAQVIKLVVMCGILLGYPIQFYIPVHILMPTILKKTNMQKKSFLCEIILRTIMVLMTVIIAASVPALGSIISLIGAVCSNALALVFPIVIEWILLPTKKVSKACKIFTFVKGVLILCMALFGFFVGIYMGVMEIVERFEAGNIYDY